MIDVSKLTVTQTTDGWAASDGRRWDTAAEAEREIRADAPAGVLVVSWEPTTVVGRRVVRAVTGG